MSRLIDLTYVRFAVEDLGAQQTFLDLFGLHTWVEQGELFARGTNASAFIYHAQQGEPAFMGLGFEAASRDALESIAAIDGVPVNENPAPGGGLIASLTDPDGTQVDVVWGMTKNEPLPVSQRSPFNDGATRPRLGERVVFRNAPHSIKRLGHCVLAVTDFRNSEAWYKQRLNLITSDEIYAGAKDNVIGAFLRCDRGDTYVDHHTLIMLGAAEPGFNHAAFEIANWDALMQGHYTLQDAGYKHSWGIGKHLLGSQVFDYWKDPNGFTLEHFTDGDLFNTAFGSHQAPVEELLGRHWGPPGAPA